VSSAGARRSDGGGGGVLEVQGRKKSKKLIEFYRGAARRGHRAPRAYTRARDVCAAIRARDTCVFTIGCRYLRRHSRCDGVINGN
jgi:hypothetical protein